MHTQRERERGRDGGRECGWGQVEGEGRGRGVTGYLVSPEAGEDLCYEGPQYDQSPKGHQQHVQGPASVGAIALPLWRDPAQL